jgi:hypothetical protein
MRGLQPVRVGLPGARTHHPAHLAPGEIDQRTGKPVRPLRQLDHPPQQPDAHSRA